MGRSCAKYAAPPHAGRRNKWAVAPALAFFLHAAAGVCATPDPRPPAPPHQKHAWEFLFRYFNIQKTFIILLAHVERRRKFFDELRFQYKRLERGVCFLMFDLRDLPHEHLDPHIVRTVKITHNPSTQIPRLAHIEHAAGGVPHYIDAGRLGEIFVVWSGHLLTFNRKTAGVLAGLLAAEQHIHRTLLDAGHYAALHLLVHCFQAHF